MHVFKLLLWRNLVLVISTYTLSNVNKVQNIWTLRVDQIGSTLVVGNYKCTAKNL